MIKLNIHEAKTHLSRYLANLAQGELILLCKRNIPFAEIRPLPRVSATARPIGLRKEEFKIPKKFFEPLPEEMLLSFAGKSPSKRQTKQKLKK